MNRIGVYGYECTKEAIFENYRMIPKYTSYSKVKKLASDPNTYHLTAILEISGNVDIRELIFMLEGVLSFIEHRDVIITNRLHTDENVNNLAEDFPTTIKAHKRHNGGGATIIADAISSKSRQQFISQAMSKLSDLSTTESKTFRSAFYKTIEVFRGRECFVDISYYLKFSALESLARAVLDDYSKSSAPPIAKLLKTYGFDIKQENLQEPHQSVMTYVELRNSLFHEGLFEARVQRDGNLVVYKLSEYSSTFSRLLPLVMIKYIGFDDGYINWNSWLDREAFKAPYKAC